MVRKVLDLLLLTLFLLRHGQTMTIINNINKKENTTSKKNKRYVIIQEKANKQQHPFTLNALNRHFTDRNDKDVSRGSNSGLVSQSAPALLLFCALKRPK